MSNNKGLSLVELLMVTLIVGGVVVFIGMSLKSAMKGQSSFLARSDVKTTIVNLSQTIAQVGRLANQNCTIGTSPTTLTCTVDTNNPPTVNVATDDTTYVFEYRKNSTNCNQNETTNCIVTTITRGSETPGSNFYQLGPDLSDSSPFSDHFILCGDAEMDAATCPIGPTGGDNNINAAHAANRAVEPNDFDGRFFRFAILATDPDYQDGRPFMIQSAFFSRNPVPGFPNELRYQWGSKG